MGQITDLRVDFVSLVDKAAVRDMGDPGSPKTFLLKKRDETRKDDTKMSTTTEPTQADREAAAAEALEALKPLGDAVDPALLAKLAGLAGQEVPAPKGEEEDEDEELPDAKLERAMADLTDVEKSVALSKAEDRERLRVAVKKAREAVELEYLHRVSPGAAQKMEASRR